MQTDIHTYINLLPHVKMPGGHFAYFHAEPDLVRSRVHDLIGPSHAKPTRLSAGWGQTSLHRWVRLRATSDQGSPGGTGPGPPEGGTIPGELAPSVPPWTRAG